MSVALRVLEEQRIDLQDVQIRLGTAENPVSEATVRRAMKSGHVTPSGQRVTLEYIRMGGRLISSVEAVERFVAKLNDINPDSPAAVAESPARSRRRQAQLACTDRELDAAGY
jgi:hypothetical protein